jgi:molybdopterin molybdotransferase
VGFELFTRPIIARLQGLDHVNRVVVNVIIDEPVESDGRESYLRVALTEQNGLYHASQVSHQGSGNLLSIVRANALLIVPSEVKSLPAGTTLQAWTLDVV